MTAKSAKKYISVWFPQVLVEGDLLYLNQAILQHWGCEYD